MQFFLWLIKSDVLLVVSVASCVSILYCECAIVDWIVQQVLHDDTLSLTPFHWFGFQYGSNSFIEYLEGRARQKRTL